MRPFCYTKTYLETQGGQSSGPVASQEEQPKMIAVTVTAGETLSGIAAQYGTSYQVLAADNHIADPNLIFVGQTIDIPSGGSGGSYSAPAASTPAYTPPSPSYVPPAPAAAPSGGGQSGGYQQSSYHIPGMPDSDANCIAFRESTDGQASSNVFQILPSSGYNVAGDSLAQQEQVAGQLYAADGMQPWAPSDGC
jgi:LysM repeat protein